MKLAKRVAKELPPYAVAIVKAREKKGWSQVQLAEKLDVGVGTVGGWESGAHGVGKQHRAAVSKLLDLPIGELVAA